jgi:hypothetical protein
MPKTAQNGTGEAQSLPEGDSPKKPRKPAKTHSGVDIDAIHKPKSNAGRPTMYSIEFAASICEKLSSGKPLRQICMEEGMPSQASVYLWLLKHPEFSEMYTRAREEQADTLADEIVAIADEQPEVIPVYDKRTGELVDHKLDNAFIQWQKNRMDARKWTAMKLKPRKYGDRVALEGTQDGAPIKVDHGIFDALIQNIELTRQSDE